VNFLSRAITYDVAMTSPHYFWVAVMCATARHLNQPVAPVSLILTRLAPS